MREAWKQYPPAQLLLAGRFGYKPPKEEKVLRVKDLVGMFKAFSQAKQGKKD